MPDPYSILSCFYYSNIFLSPQAKKGFPRGGSLDCRKRCAHPLAPSARGLRPQAVGERTVRLSEIFRAMARFSPSAPSGHRSPSGASATSPVSGESVSQREVFRHAGVPRWGTSFCMRCRCCGASPSGLRPQARVEAQPPEAALSAETEAAARRRLMRAESAIVPR